MKVIEIRINKISEIGYYVGLLVSAIVVAHKMIVTKDNSFLFAFLLFSILYYLHYLRHCATFVVKSDEN